jgi:predicted phosphoribosyltransferase
MALFKDRADAGEKLAWELGATRDLRGPGTVVLGLPRGGVPVAAEIARQLDAPLDVLVVRKLGHPGQPELVIGAVAVGGQVFLNEDIVRESSLSEAAIEKVAERERRELLRREAVYRAGRPPLDLAGRRAVLVDDGLATGATMRAAIRAARALGATSVIVAVPVAAPDACTAIRAEADDLVCLSEPVDFVSVGSWYADFAQVTDAEVMGPLAASRASGQ